MTATSKYKQNVECFRVFYSYPMPNGRNLIITFLFMKIYQDLAEIIVFGNTFLFFSGDLVLI